MKKLYILIAVITVFSASCKKTAASNNDDKTVFPQTITVKGIAINPEGIAFNKNNNTFFLSSLNAAPITKVNLDGTYEPFTSGEKFPLSTAGIQIDYKNNRLLAAGFNGAELYDGDPATKGTSYLRIYNLETGVIEKDINLSFLAPNATAYFANDIAIDSEGNAYITDWYAGVIYKVDLAGNPSLFWSNTTGIPSGLNGIDFHSDGYLLASLVSVNNKGLYADFGLVKIPVNDANLVKVVTFSNAGYTGFDGMVLNAKGNVIGVTNNGTTPGGNTLIELTSSNNWKSAKVISSKAMTPSTTVAATPENLYYVINQDFTNGAQEDWVIELIKF